MADTVCIRETLSFDPEWIAADARRKYGPFIRDAVVPGVASRDRTRTPHDRSVFQEAARLGMIGYSLPRSIGGQGRETSAWGLALEEISFLSGDPGFTVFLDIAVNAAQLIVAAGRPGLIERYAEPSVSGAMLGAVAFSEGRDQLDPACRAKPTGEGWLLHVRKPIVLGAQLADYFIVSAMDEDSGDLVGFVLDRADPGLLIAPLAGTGLHSPGFGSLAAMDVVVGHDRLLWDHDGLSQIMSYVRRRRLMMAASMSGVMRSAFEACLEELSQRRRGGKVVLDFANVQKTIGEMRVAIETSRAMLRQGMARGFTSDESEAYELVSATKQHVADRAVWLTQAVVQLFGFEGFLNTGPWERYARDALAALAGGGPQETMLLHLGQCTISQRDLRRQRVKRFQAKLDELDRSRWTLTALTTALESGMLARLSAPVDLADLTSHLSASPELVSATVDVLVDVKAVRRSGDLFVMDDEVLPMVEDHLTALSACTGLRSALRDLEGLDERLQKRGSAVLCVGGHGTERAGALGRWFVAADISCQAAAGAGSGAAAGSRSEADATFDLVWMSADCATSEQVEAAHHLLQAGGWILLQSNCYAGDALSRFRAVATDGRVITVDDARHLLEAAGLTDVRTFPDGLVAARSS
ncbi:acyl-CoA dehydrogenase family protein [Nonomuraea insulae]|uniref:Acyl-CoA dehydrogenase family protein n=1 Tax=Nonomuraea insulae TaxID=1616787 RepID=A0ABW1CNZ7_9ACTN